MTALSRTLQRSVRIAPCVPAMTASARWKGGQFKIDFRQRDDVPPSQPGSRLYNDQFIYQTTAKHIESRDTRPAWPQVSSATELVPMWHRDPHAHSVLMAAPLHYSRTQPKPTFPLRPTIQWDSSGRGFGELCVGAELTRTTAWVKSGEPAIVSVARCEPGAVRAFGYSENVPVISDAHGGSLISFDQARLPVGHADRRPFIAFCGAVAAMVILSAVRTWIVRLIGGLWPGKSVWAAGVIEMDVSHIDVGVNQTVKWCGKPVFVRHRSPAMIASAQRDDALLSSMRHPQTDAEICKKEDWLVCIGICTHLGCIPFPDQGDYGGYFCPCHGSHYDHAGRIRKGPAPFNLEIPKHEFLSATTLKLGS